VLVPGEYDRRYDKILFAYDIMSRAEAKLLWLLFTSESIDLTGGLAEKDESESVRHGDGCERRGQRPQLPRSVIAVLFQLWFLPRDAL